MFEYAKRYYMMIVSHTQTRSFFACEISSRGFDIERRRRSVQESHLHKVIFSNAPKIPRLLIHNCRGPSERRGGEKVLERKWNETFPCFLCLAQKWGSQFLPIASLPPFLLCKLSGISSNEEERGVSVEKMSFASNEERRVSQEKSLRPLNSGAPAQRVVRTTCN